MEWLRTHPYTAALGATGLLFVLGVFIVITRASAPATSTQTVAWGGAGAIVNSTYAPSNTGTQGNIPTIMQQTQSSPPYNFILPAPQTVNPDTGAATDGFDYNAFIAMLSAQGGSASGRSQSNTSTAGNAYAFIPGGLVSATSTTKSRTKLQQSLYNYGNDVSSYIQSFEQSYPNESQLLIDQAQDRTNTTKAAAVQALAHALGGLGDSLLAMDSVPSQMTATHQALAKSYQDLGAKLALVPQAQGDPAFITAVQNYNAAADAFTKNYVSMANLFVAYGVVFTQNDPGSVFTFTNTSL